MSSTQECRGQEPAAEKELCRRSTCRGGGGCAILGDEGGCKPTVCTGPCLLAASGLGPVPQNPTETCHHAPVVSDWVSQNFLLPPLFLSSAGLDASVRLTWGQTIVRGMLTHRLGRGQQGRLGLQHLPSSGLQASWPSGEAWRPSAQP